MYHGALLRRTRAGRPHAQISEGKAKMADTATLLGVLGWDKYAREAEQLCEYFPSSGIGQVKFHSPSKRGDSATHNICLSRFRPIA
jgi:hypothetical protein